MFLVLLSSSSSDSNADTKTPLQTLPLSCPLPCPVPLPLPTSAGGVTIPSTPSEASAKSGFGDVLLSILKKLKLLLGLLLGAICELTF